MSTATVVDRIQLPTVEDFERIYREHAALVYRTAWGALGSREDAEDVLQTVFLKLLRREFPPDLQKNPSAYLYRAAVNASLDILKARRRRPFLLEDAESIKAAAPASDSVFDDEMHARLHSAIGRLSLEAAEVVVLRYMHQKSTATIAEMLGVSRTVVGVRLFRARARLKALLRVRSGEKHETR